MAQIISRIFAVLMISAAVVLVVFGKRPTEFKLPDAQGQPKGATVRGRVVVTFWEKWTRHEARAMQDIVDRYNLSQERVFVNMVSMSQINQKMLIATAGGDPPDIVGLWAAQIAPYTANNALEPLDELVAEGAITEKTYKPYVWRICAPGGRLHAVSATPSTCALYWNKDMFRAAGLDPEKPPKTIEELDALAEKLTVRKNGELQQTGFLPNEPGWWDYYWGIYWGNVLYDQEQDRFNINTPAQVAAYSWYQSYPRKYGLEDVQSFQSGFGQFNSPQNAFINGKVAMIVQGPFFAKFIELNNPGMVGHYGVTFVPLPESLHKEAGAIALGDLDNWVIPRGAKHKREALEVLKFFSRRDNMEYLCKAHAKPSPLMDVSADFLSTNPHPYIDVFEKTMLAPIVVTMPESPVWERVQAEINTANGNMWREPERYPAKETLQRTQKICDGYVTEFKHYAQMRQRAKNKMEN